MKIQMITDSWKMKKDGSQNWIQARVPGSIYSNLLQCGELKNPYVGENQYEVFEKSFDNYVFAADMIVHSSMLDSDRLFLRFDGIDTVSTIILNGMEIGKTNNMHRSWEYEVKTLLREGINTMEVRLQSPLQYIQEKQKEHPLWGLLLRFRDTAI